MGMGSEFAEVARRDRALAALARIGDAAPCWACGRARAECRPPDNPFLSCCDACSANDGDTHRTKS